MRTLTELNRSAAQSSLKGRVGASHKHESADKHVSGEAVYVDDRPALVGQVHAAIGQSSIAHGRILSMDLSAVRAAEGVVAVITATDIPGKVDIGPVYPGDPVLAEELVEFVGQPIFAVAATSQALARKAVALARIDYQALPPILSIKAALAQQNFVRPSHTQARGDAPAAIAQAPHRLTGELSIGGQEHFYLEGQVSCAEPTEDGGMTIYTSSQHPSEVQKLVAEVLGIPFNLVTLEMRRMGGGFGGKETQAAPWACIAALLARHTGRAVKLRLSRRDDMLLTGKRHPFENTYRVGFDETGLIKGIEITVNGNCGYSPDLSDAIVDRAMFHSDNAYYLDQAKIVGNRCKTNTVSHTAFRGFGGPQGMMTIECVMDDIARYLGKDPLAIRQLNLYGQSHRNITHYHQQVEQNLLPEIIETLAKNADYQQRRKAIVAFNAEQQNLKKGIALTPVKFGISFTVQHLNQAGALIHIYTDGSIHLNHGGTEMGQGLFQKVAQVAASVFAVDMNVVKITATDTAKVPNTSATAASSGSDLNGMAVKAACETIRERISTHLAESWRVAPGDVVFSGGQVQAAGHPPISFAEAAGQAYFARISLSSTGFYKTPKITWDRIKGRGRPFLYFAHGVALCEVVIDTLTGENRILRTDIIHDTGNSLNPALDVGQVEGAFVQGAGWLTTEELVWDDAGRLRTHAPSTYKIPASSDRPRIFNVDLWNKPNSEDTVGRSKAVGEPPFMLGISAWLALADAISACGDGFHDLNAPATAEEVLASVDRVRSA